MATKWQHPQWVNVTVGGNISLSGNNGAIAVTSGSLVVRNTSGWTISMATTTRNGEACQLLFWER